MRTKALVVGGSNGIGLAISNALINKGYFIEICDVKEPDEGILQHEGYRFYHTDLYYFDDELFETLAKDHELSLLIITAGIGRVADFRFHHIGEINKILTIDTLSIIKLIHVFYNRILSNEGFFVGVMGSISGWISTPAASVYSAAKAGIVRFIESVNIELEIAGTANRILDVSPGSFKGSKFYGGNNDLPALMPLAEEILLHIMARDTLFIPQYHEIYKNVLQRYHDNPHEYGLHSYRFKQESGRLDNKKKCIIGYLSGTFDLFHVGHLNLLQRAKAKCDYLIVGVHNSGKWKGKETFIPFDERKRIVGACKYVDKVVESCLEDSDAWALYHFDRLFVGSDYKGSERFNRYETYFEDKGVEIVYFPYTQSTNSTQIRKMISNRNQNTEELGE